MSSTAGSTAVPQVPAVLAIGWDVGGWGGRRHGIATIRYSSGSHWSTACAPTAVRLPAGLESFDEWKAWACGLCGHSSAATRVVVAIDAPFGLPVAFGDLLDWRPAQLPRERMLVTNPYALRKTDRWVAARFKLPLSAAFDKLGNNATVAMHHLAFWRAQGVRVLPFDADDDACPTALEVYPAIVRTDREGSQPEWVRTLLSDCPRGDLHTDDALVCAALALAWACPGAAGAPRLERAPSELPDREGWIYYPENSAWSPRG